MSSRRPTSALLALVLLLLGVVVAETWYLAADHTPAASVDRPVVTGEVTYRAAVDAAAQSTEEILSTDFRDYDQEVAEARTLMTDGYAERYQQTVDGVRDRFLARRTRLRVSVVDQGVVRAEPDRVQALLFLNQAVQQAAADGPITAVSQYRALVTVVHSGRGWLVSSIDVR
jgi:Mce-associated membrane protein